MREGDDGIETVAELRRELPVDRLVVVAFPLVAGEAEGLAREAATPSKKPKSKVEKDADTKALERTLSEALGLKVEIQHKGADGGHLVISYKTLDQLEDVCRRLQA